MKNNQIFIEQKSPYNVDSTVEKLIEYAKEKKWKSFTVDNFHQNSEKTNNISKPVKILEICKQEYSGYIHKKNIEKPSLLMMMPCRISVYEKEDGRTYVSLLNMSAMVTGLPQYENDIISKASLETIEIVKSVVGAF